MVSPRRARARTVGSLMRDASTLHVFVSCIGVIAFIVVVVAGMGLAALASARADAIDPPTNDMQP